VSPACQQAPVVTNKESIMMRRCLVLFCGLLLSVSAIAAKEKKKPAEYNPFSQQEKQLISKINKTGVAIIKQGDRLMMIIPVDQYFYPSSTRVREDRKVDLQRIALFVRGYIRRYQKPTIQVNGYTDRVFSHKTRKQLSQDLADIIGNYLWTFGVAEKLITTKGYGAENPLADQQTPKGAAFNRRVEVVIK